MAERLKPLFHNIISPEQGGYVEGRKIVDEIILAQEAIHSMEMQKYPSMFICLDLYKGYDRVH